MEGRIASAVGGAAVLATLLVALVGGIADATGIVPVAGAVDSPPVELACGTCSSTNGQDSGGGGG
ncbi:MAG: hypothetical protein M3220_04990 [Chloroflexota bacterium]|nr:hypothetical protein [Chloroflexota bacterium]